VNSRQPSARSRKKARRLAVAAPSTVGSSPARPRAGPAGAGLPPRTAEEGRRPQAQQKPGARQVAEPVDADRPPRTDGRHKHAGQECPEGDRAAGHQALKRVGLLKPWWADDLGHEARVSGAEEGFAHAHPDLQDGKLPHMGDAGDEQGGGRQLEHGASDIGGEHHQTARKSVRPDAAQQHEHDQRNQTGSLDDTDVGGRAADGEHCERQRHHAEHRADHRGGLPDEQLAELGFPKRGEAVPQPAQAIRRAAGAGPARPGSTSSSGRAAA
jgi:hypothetical protein